MKFVLAPDSFKGCMTAKQAAQAMKRGILKTLPRAQIATFPMADGGEGTTQSLVDALHGRFVTVKTVDPLGRPTHARYGLIDYGRIAVIEMAAASGIQYIDSQSANPLRANTYGTGLLIKDALSRHVNKIVMGLGGSATNDGGAGMAAALGVNFLDSGGQEVRPWGGRLHRITRIDVRHLNPGLQNTPVIIASDVTSPLVGPNGASAVFGPQKGATPEMVKTLDTNLKHYAQVIKRDLGLDLAYYPGAGAAGGLGAGLLAFTRAQMKRGIQIVMHLTHLKDRLENADVVITGEGSIDFQTQYGKVPVGVAQLAKRVSPQAKVIALGGHVGKHLTALHRKGIDTILPIVPGAISLKKAIKTGPQNLEAVAANLAALFR